MRGSSNSVISQLCGCRQVNPLLCACSFIDKSRSSNNSAALIRMFCYADSRNPNLHWLKHPGNLLSRKTGSPRVQWPLGLETQQLINISENAGPLISSFHSTVVRVPFIFHLLAPSTMATEVTVVTWARAPSNREECLFFPIAPS